MTMKFHGSIKIGAMKHGEMQEAHLLDLDASFRPLTVDEMSTVFMNPKFNIYTARQTASIDDYLSDHDEELPLVKENRMAGFMIYLDHPDRGTELIRLSLHHACNHNEVANKLLSTLLLPLEILVRSQDKALISLLRKKGFKKISVHKNKFKTPKDSGVVMYYDGVKGE